MAAADTEEEVVLAEVAVLAEVVPGSLAADLEEAVLEAVVLAEAATEAAVDLEVAVAP